MYLDQPVVLRPGDEIAWNITLVDGEADGWPAQLLVDTAVEIEDPPAGVRSGLVARTPDFAAVWGGRSPVGSRFRIRAGLEGDWFNPPFQATLGGKIRRLLVVSNPPAQSTGPADCPVPGGWRLHEITDAPAGLPKPGDDGELWCGLLIRLAVREHHLAAFTPPA
jgi:hypothetical protein